jgi:hypothetical protein
MNMSKILQSIRQCFNMLKKSNKKGFTWMTEATEGFLDSDEEDALHREIDSITATQDRQDALGYVKEDGWEREAARLFNSLSLQIATIESAFSILQQILCCSLAAGMEPDTDPMLSMEVEI